MNRWYPFVGARADFRCEYCRAPERGANFAFEVEHIHPQALEGQTVSENLALSCRACNLFKADHVVGVDPETGVSVRLFHPRNDVWTDHFELDYATPRLAV